MRGVQWDSGRGLRCGDCGGYEIDLLEDGRSRCRSCGRLSKPRRVPRYAGMGRALLWISGLFLFFWVVEGVAAWYYANRTGGSFAQAFSWVAFVTGFAAIIVAGASAMPGRVAFGNMRFDPLGRTYPLHPPQVADPGSVRERTRGARDPGAMGAIALAVLGATFIFVALVVGRM